MMNLKYLPLALALALASVPMHSMAQPTTPSPATETTTDWAAWGGTVGVRLNENLLQSIGIRVANPTNRLSASSARLTDGLNVRQALGSELFALRQSGSIQFRADRGSFAGFLAGSLQSRGGYTLKLDGGDTIPLVDFRLRPNAENPMWLDVVSGDGEVWFYVDKLMYELVNDNHVLAIYTADMRVTRALAERVGHPEMADAPVGDLEILTEITQQGGGGIKDLLGTPSPSHWHGEQVVGQPSGVVYQTDLFMQNISVARNRSSGVTGPEGNGRVVFAPSSTLRNNVNVGTAVTTISGQGAAGISSALWTAWVPWYSKFSVDPDIIGAVGFRPYNNDQHPFLIWNMYRINADGSIEQIARSGVKHAWLTTNFNCASGENFDNHVLGRSCSDTYSNSNNDANQDLSFRSEIIPATGQWGRCRSLFDPGCVSSNTNSSPSDDGYVRRMVVNESQISSTKNPGATYLFDSWYLARQDINIYNSMATVTGTPVYSGDDWNFAGVANFKLGSVTDRWIENPPANTLAVQNAELSVGEGHAKVAVRVMDAGNGKQVYHYAVHNLDYSRAVTAGAEPNLEVISNKGFDRFRVPIPAGVSVIDSRFSDGDLDSGNDWSFSSAGGYLTWTAPSGQSLDWGTLYSFSVTTYSDPVSVTSQLRPATSGIQMTYGVPTLAPSASDIIFQHGFDSP
ncbi:MAG TPA: hypothetical protein VFN25_14080 [Dokdonella sp.]|uniref:hypothetical protein n=1 Tax=Dokdonella sp. TaxID=2291710 RepID=UPI002D7EA3D5|nr:hypothetical protein [Dokdonella sp.]HET9034017.1 hypothetical protein [Dokdonella sp.]